MKLNIVPARAGIQWVRLGVVTFLRQPLALSGLFFMLFAMTLTLLLLIPFVGALASAVLMPAGTLGMMAATRTASQGKFPMPSVLLTAFRAGRQKTRDMLLLGAIYAAVLLLIHLVTLPFGTQMEGTSPAAPAASAASAAASAAMANPMAQPGLLLGMLLQLPFLVLFSHAPALVYWHGLSPMKALFFSAVAFLRNFGAFVLFGLGWLLALFAVGAVLSLFFAIFGSAPSLQAVSPVALLVMAAMCASMYFTFRDSFVTDEPASPLELPGGPPP
ncbi:BPSS1780 family membrane protein [Ramlibacter sp.]|uniref:BPSS1780 family membrane protein n=1 Tax=Ramlibacter sp. TaxID=1917967 RepID=UPI003D0F9C9E